MKALFLGGTGIISSSITELLISLGWELTLVNRGNHNTLFQDSVNVIQADCYDEISMSTHLKDKHYDVVVDFIAYTPEHIEKDIRLFSGKTNQFIFISSASAYQKPLASPYITESTPVSNPYWDYSQKKIECENKLMDAYRHTGFPITIIRPSHTYCNHSIPVALHGAQGSYSIINRMRKGKAIIIPGDGTGLWTLTHSKDFAKGFCGLMGNIHAIGETYQITGDESLTWNQIHDCIANACGVKANFVHIASDMIGASCADFKASLLGDKSNTVIFDNQKLKRAVPDFVATIRFDQGIRETIKYFDSHPELQVEDPAFDAWCDQMILLNDEMKAKLPKFSL